ncbi:O-linked N-acetylglucosamine transferase family protein [Kiloniella majae]|uniref:O-linked N-acetylglucosamine transferase, SPINDLY family protein n=1 Tax=Kiloniella majae TaxID=1938558 RepID=UPI000A2780CC|nr:tetratricopeptide repeat protein [Kiloniella majae]
MNSFDEKIEKVANDVLVLLMTDKVKDAIYISEQYLKQNILHPYFLFAQTISFLSGNSHQEFHDSFQNLKTIPNITYADFHNFGLFFQRNQAHQLAAECFGESINKKPDFFASYIQLAKIFIALDNFESAINAYIAALEISPQDLESHQNLGLCYEKLLQSELALEIYKKGLAHHPESRKLNIGIARCYLDLGAVQEAYSAFMTNLEDLSSKSEQDFLHLLYQERKSLTYRQIIEISHLLGFTKRQISADLLGDIRNNFSSIPIKILSLFSSKKKHHRLKLTANITILPFVYWEILLHYILTPLKLLPETEEHLKTPYPVLKGQMAYLLSRLFIGRERALTYRDSAAQALYHMGRINEAEKIAQDVLKTLPTTERSDNLSRILLASEDYSNEEFYTISKKNMDALPTLESSPIDNINMRADRVLNVGMLCDFFDGQIAAYTLIPQLKNHDPNKIRVYLYDSGSGKAQDKYPTQVYRYVKQLDDNQLKDLIREDNIDILIEMNGPLRPSNRLGVLKRRAAPIQASWYNLCATTGIKEVDYVITDKISVPAQQQRYFTEKLLFLSGNATGGWKLENNAPVTSPPFQKNKFFTFGCFGASFKINPKMISIWSEILHATPTTKLLIKTDMLDKITSKLLLVQSFAREGISPNRLIFEGLTSYQKMCEKYQDIDLSLDTFPYSNGSTTMNSLWQGVPVLTIAGPDWRSRTTTSIMGSAGFNQFICKDKEEYISRAVEIANAPQQLSTLRQEMRAHLLNHSRYFQIEKFSHDFEDGLRDAWHEYISTNYKYTPKSRDEASMYE